VQEFFDPTGSPNPKRQGAWHDEEAEKEVGGHAY
jgi:hypothetical protein